MISSLHMSIPEPHVAQCFMWAFRSSTDNEMVGMTMIFRQPKQNSPLVQQEDRTKYIPTVKMPKSSCLGDLTG